MNIEYKNLDDILEIAARHMRESPIAAGPSTELIDRTVSGMRRARRQKRPWSALSLMAASLLLIIGAAGWFVTRLPALRREVRPLYQEMGILPHEPPIQQ